MPLEILLGGSQALSKFIRQLASLRSVEEAVVDRRGDLEDRPHDHLAVLDDHLILAGADHDDCGRQNAGKIVGAALGGRVVSHKIRASNDLKRQQGGRSQRGTRAHGVKGT